MTTILPMVKARFDDSDGTPLEGGSVEFFEAGSSTPKDTFRDLAGTITNTNPVILDTRGEAEIRLGDGLYKVIVKDSAEVIQHTIDNVSVLGSVGTTIDIVNNIAELKALSVTNPPEIVEVLGYFNPPVFDAGGTNNTDQADAGGGLFHFNATATSFDNGINIKPDSGNGIWIRVFDGPVSVKWFGAEGEYIFDNGSINSGATDDTTAINETLLYARTNDLAVKVPTGAYRLSGALICGVQMIGDQKPRMDTNVKYADTIWETTVAFEGSAFIWDESTLTTSDTFIKSPASEPSDAVKFKNLIFLSNATTGGGTLLIASTDQTTTANYDFGNLPPFEDCYICNFAIGIKIETFRGMNLNTIEFRGCQRATLLGIVVTDLAEQISFNGCMFKNCGDGSTSFIKLEATDAIYFNKCIFDTTSQIEITILSGVGMLFSECYYRNQKGGAGVGGGTFAFIKSNTDIGAATENVSFYKTIGGADAGDIDLSLSPSTASLTIIDSDLKSLASGSDLILDDTIVTEIGTVNFGTITGTGLDNKFTSGGFQSQGIKFDVAGKTRQIKLLTTADDEQISLTPTDSVSTTDGSQIILKANLDAGGAADIDILSGIGSNPGDINLTTKAGQAVKINTGDLDITTSVVSDVKLSVAAKGLFVKHVAGTSANGFRAGTVFLTDDGESGGTTAGEIAITCDQVSGNSSFILTRIAENGSTQIGILGIKTIIGSGFTIRSYSDAVASPPPIQPNDRSKIFWMIIEPS